MTIDAHLESPPLPRRRRADETPLPGCEERRRLRRTWNLSEAQVAAAFGVTVATVRSWESGRTSPNGRRREAYSAFLRGLAQAASARAARPPVPRPEAATRRSPSPDVTTVLRPRSPRAPGYQAPPVPAPTPPKPASAVRVLSVSPPRDPVSPVRWRRWHLAAASAGVWAAALHLVLTCPPPHL
ncbi:helix-turn-helix domain-containing protein [Streptomyces sp. NPDC058872]|uniref:helix-turn-helix domain-containing protein n=1 Tax=Streptomyces sp. NPDC058872 TaxID=3346661 RepID=UPI00367BFE81